jgi:SAM-dependent methyltransferase
MCDIKGTGHEIHFWSQYLPAKYYKFTTRRRFKGYFGEMIGKKKKIRVADLGCGALPLTGNDWPGVEVEYVPSDLLAVEYMDLWRSINQVPVIPIEMQTMDSLTYADESFDIVHCANALDHCQDPFKSIREMYRICKPPGWLFRRHIPHEGKRLRYSGMHQWNFDISENNDCRVWNETTEFLLTQCVHGFYSWAEGIGTGHPWIYSKYHKVEPYP